MTSTGQLDVRVGVDLDRFIREPPTPYAEATAARAALDRVNRETRERNRESVRSFLVSTLD